MAPFRKELLAVLSMLVLLAGFVSCGGGGGSDTGFSEPFPTDPPSGSFPSKILTWNPPTQYTDGTALDFVTELDSFEIYINENGAFSDTDPEMASVAARDPGTGQPATAFDLSNLAPFLSPGVTYHVSIRAVTLTGLRSDFSPSATFSF